MKKRDGVLRVVRTQLYKGKVEEEKWEETRIDVKAFETEPAMVGMEIGGTFNLGNYEGARLFVSLTVPCYVEEIPEVFEQVKAFLSEKANAELQPVKDYVVHKKELF